MEERIDQYKKIYKKVNLKIATHLNYISDEDSFFEVAEAVFVGWFTFEYVIRFIAAPRKLR